VFVDILRYRGQRFAWVAILLSLVAGAIYLTHADLPAPSGSTWQGYVLGSVGALLILWLMMLGIRKRSYNSSMGTVQGWVSAHVYLGLALVVVTTLHTGGQFGWNVHTFAYVVMCLVVASGIYGVFAYRSMPRKLSDIRAGNAREDLFGELYGLNQDAIGVARQCSEEVSALVESSVRETKIGGSALAQLAGSDASTLTTATGQQSNHDQQVAVDYVSELIPKGRRESEAVLLQQLLSVLCRRQIVLRRIRRDIKYQARVKLWLYIHVPFTVALLGALIVHVLSVFLYW